MAGSVWPLVHAERQALVDDVATLGPDDWRASSLCAGWSVHDVLGHMTATAEMTPPRFVALMARSRFDFDRMTRKEVARTTAGGPPQTLAAFRARVDATTHPPGPLDSWLGETVVHGEDIRRPLGIRHSYPEEALRRIASFYPRSNLLIGVKRRVAGLLLEATDAEWRLGDGPLVRGPLLSLVLAMTGRAVGLHDLTGDGVEMLRRRSQPTGPG